MDWDDVGKDRLFRPSYQNENVQPYSMEDPIDALPYIAAAFSEAAAARFEQVKSYSFDGDAYPIVFLYRHACELYLKAIVLQGDRTLAHRKQALTGLTNCENGIWRFNASQHRLVPLFDGAVRAVAALGWSWPGVEKAENAATIRLRIVEIDEIDAGSFSFRYPMTNTGAPVLPRDSSFELGHFVLLIQAIVKVLHDVALNCESEWENATFA